MFGAPLSPDGPPLDRRAAQRYSAQTADTVEEGYAAFYQDDRSDWITVYALRFAPRASAPDPTPASRNDVKWLRFADVVAIIQGASGDCRQAIETHVDTVIAAKNWLGIGVGIRRQASRRQASGVRRQRMFNPDR